MKIRFLVHFGASLIRLFVLYLSMLFPRSKKIILFGSWWGNKYDDNPKALFDYVITNRKDIKALWFTSNKSVYNNLKQEGKPVIMSNSVMAKWFMLRAYCAVICTHPFDMGKSNTFLAGNMIIANLWHGVPLKKIVYDDEKNYSRESKKGFNGWVERAEKYPRRKTYYFSTSDTIHKIYQSCFNVIGDKVINIGQVRNDYFFIEHNNPFRSKYPFEKIVLYMPTHRQEGHLVMDMNNILDLEKLNFVLQKQNSIMLIKKHYYHAKEKEIESAYSNIIEITNEQPNAQELLDAADILITDYSSCYIDYLLLDRPIIFYSFDLDKYLAEDRDLYFDYKSIVPGRICTTKTELNEEVQKSLSGIDDYAQIRNKAKGLYYSKINQQPVAERTINEILNKL